MRAQMEWEGGRSRGRAGFTLIELTVVLVILIALAGILVPQLSGYINRSHSAASSTNIGEITKFFQLYDLKYLKGYPNNYERGCTDTGAAPNKGSVGTLAFVIGSEGSAAVFARALDAGQVSALASKGITSVLNMQATVPAGSSATFDAADEVTGPVALNTSDKVLFLDRNFVKSAFGLAPDPSEEYVAFGIGSDCTAVGKVMIEAPLHFDQVDPVDVYSRFFVVYAVPTKGAAASFNARLVGALGSELSSLSAEIAEYYSKDSQ